MCYVWIDDSRLVAGSFLQHFFELLQSHGEITKIKTKLHLFLLFLQRLKVLYFLADLNYSLLHQQLIRQTLRLLLGLGILITLLWLFLRRNFLIRSLLRYIMGWLFFWWFVSLFLARSEEIMNIRIFLQVLALLFTFLFLLNFLRIYFIN